jgi:alanine racemase
MDQVLVDVTEIPGVVVGEEAILIGEGVTVVELARRGETNVHEIITRIMSRVPRRYRYE